MPPIRLPRCFRPVLLGFAAGALLSGGISFPVQATIPLPDEPDWQGTPLGQYGTGCALRDLDGDGLPDLVVANGNDMARQPLSVYRNTGGTFPLTPTWTSADVDYQGHLDLADVDGDGNLDCAVGVYIGAGGFSTPGRVKLYHGNGDGTFSSMPVWSCATAFYCFSVSFGDVNMDGRPDLACAAGEPYGNVRERYRVFRNVAGTLETTPFWQSADVRSALDVTWGDVNGDGFLDLVFAGSTNGTPAVPDEVYYGNGVTLQTAPGWRSLDGHYSANTLCLGDLNGDGWLDLAVADNDQNLGGTGNGRFKLFLNNGAGVLASTPVWTSTFDGYGSHVSFGDVDADGDLDLAAGSWWGALQVYENQSGTLPVLPTWQSSTNSVIENVVWEDANNDGLEPGLTALFTGNGMRSLFLVPRRPIRVESVEVGGVPLTPSQFFACAAQGWLSLGTPPAPGVSVAIRYTASHALDLAVSNWDEAVGEYLFLNTRDPAGVPSPQLAEAGEAALRVMPNPAPRGSIIRFSGPAAAARQALVLSVDGRVVRVLDTSGAERGAGLTWDGREANGHPAAAGSYLVRTEGAGRPATVRLTLVR